MNHFIVAQACDGSKVLCEPVPQEEALQRDMRHKELVLEIKQRGIRTLGGRPVFADTGEIIY